MSRSKNGISDPFTSNIIPLPGEFCEHRRPGYQPELGGWVFFLNGVTVFTRDTKQIPVDQLSVTALMAPPMCGLMEPLLGADFGSQTGSFFRAFLSLFQR